VAVATALGAIAQLFPRSNDQNEPFQPTSEADCLRDPEAFGHHRKDVDLCLQDAAAFRNREEVRFELGTWLAFSSAAAFLAYFATHHLYRNTWRSHPIHDLIDESLDEKFRDRLWIPLTAGILALLSGVCIPSGESNRYINLRDFAFNLGRILLFSSLVVLFTYGLFLRSPRSSSGFDPYDTCPPDDHSHGEGGD
jgi:hypothetical protein